MNCANITVSPEDMHLLEQYKWYVGKNRKTGKLYVFTNIDGKKVYLHRLIMNARKGELVDHKDRNPLNNKRNNLRIVTHAENSQNIGTSARSRTGQRGVFFEKFTGKYRVQFAVGGKKKSYGRFDTLEEAVAMAKSVIKEE